MSTEPLLRRSGRASALAISEIVRLSEQATELRRAGRDVIALTTGEPDFPTPDFVIDAAHAAARNGQTRYTPTAGELSLREAVASEVGVTHEQVIISNGAKQVLANAFIATLDEGDEVIMAAPYWTTYADQVQLAGARPVVIPCDDSSGFKLTPARLRDSITSRTRWVLLNSPSNPSGAVYSAAEYQALAAVLRDYPDVWVIADEIYEHLCYVPFTSFLQAAPELQARTLIVNGVSKAWSMTGWRVGWGVGPADLIAAMAAVQGQFTSGACSVAQAAALAALKGDRSFLLERRALMQARRDRLVAGLNALPGVSCASPDGAFYAFADLRGAIGQGGFRDEAQLCARLLETVGLVIVPGRAFGVPGHARLTFAYADDVLDAALDKFAAGLSMVSSAHTN